MKLLVLLCGLVGATNGCGKKQDNPAVGPPARIMSLEISDMASKDLIEVALVDAKDNPVAFQGQAEVVVSQGGAERCRASVPLSHPGIGPDMKSFTAEATTDLKCKPPTGDGPVTATVKLTLSDGKVFEASAGRVVLLMDRLAEHIAATAPTAPRPTAEVLQPKTWVWVHGDGFMIQAPAEVPADQSALEGLGTGRTYTYVNTDDLVLRLIVFDVAVAKEDPEKFFAKIRDLTKTKLGGLKLVDDTTSKMAVGVRKDLRFEGSDPDAGEFTIRMRLVWDGHQMGELDAIHPTADASKLDPVWFAFTDSFMFLGPPKP